MIDRATAPVETGAPPPKPDALGTTRKRRGRPFTARPTAASPLPENPVTDPPGDAPQPEPRKQRRQKQTIDIGLLARQLKGIHELAANILPLQWQPAGPGTPIRPLIVLSDLEAEELAKGIAAVAKEYDLELDGKTGAAIQLLSAAVMIYGPRVYFINKVKQAMREGKKDEQQTDSSIVAEQSLNGSATAAAN